jgi:hypothetical protein
MRWSADDDDDGAKEHCDVSVFAGGRIENLPPTTATASRIKKKRGK